MNRKIILITLTLLLAATSSFSAQTTSSPPVPSQLATATRIFIASGDAPASGRYEKLMASMVYVSLYHALSTGGRYQLQPAPADAELSMTITLLSDVTNVSSGSSLGETFLRLEIFDVKTHTLLWALDEPVEGAFREKTFRKNVDASIALLESDLNLLAQGKVPGDDTIAEAEPPKTDSLKKDPCKTQVLDSQSTKTRFSQADQKESANCP